MKFIIKEWPDRSVTLMTANGYALSTFDSAQQAHLACQAWYEANSCPRQAPSLWSTQRRLSR